MPRARPSKAAGRGLVVAMLAAAAFAAPAQADVAPGHSLTARITSSSVDLGGYPATAPLSVDLLRNGIVIGRAAGTTDGTGALGIGASGACWSVFTPEMRPGDTVRVAGTGVADSMVVQAVSVNGPVSGGAVGADTIITGTSPDPARVTAVLLNAGDEVASTAPDAGTNWIATFVATSLPVSPGAQARFAGTDGGTTVADNPLPPRPSAACAVLAPFHDTAVTVVDPGHLVGGVPTINAAGAGQALTVSGPGAGLLTVTLGGAEQSAPVQGGTWTATFAATDLAALPEGTVNLGVTGGVGLTMTKDTVAPGPPTSTPPPGRYFAPPLVTLAPPEPGAVVHYTLDGSAPGFDSPTFGAAIHVTSNETIRAFAVDAAGNPGPVALLPYQLAPAVPPPGMPPVPDNPGTTPGEPPPPVARVAITLVKRISLPRLKAHGLTATVELGQGTTAVRFTVYRRVMRRGHRRLKLVASVVRVPGRAGRYRVKLNPRALGLTREGLYRLKIVPGLSRATLDDSATRTVWLRIVR